MTKDDIGPQSMFIARRQLGTAERVTEPVINPATGVEVTTVPDGTAHDFDTAVNAAMPAFEGWANTPPGERARWLSHVADHLNEHAEEFPQLGPMDVGKPTSGAGEETSFVMGKPRFFAGAGRALEGWASAERILCRTGMVRRDRLGIVGSAGSWKFPFGMAGWKIAPAPIAGNTLTIKPNELTPLSTLRLTELAADLVPEGDSTS